MSVEPKEKALEFDLDSFRPSTNTLIIEIVPPKEMTDGGLFIPDSVQEEQQVGKIIAVPDDPSCPYRVGQYALFSAGSGIKVNIFGRDDLIAVQWESDLTTEILGHWDCSDVET